MFKNKTGRVVTEFDRTLSVLPEQGGKELLVSLRDIAEDEEAKKKERKMEFTLKGFQVKVEI